MRVPALMALVMLGASGFTAGGPPQLGLGLARVSAPPAILFDVPNVAESVASAPVSVSFDSAVLLVGQALRISVRADGDLTIAGGPAIPASALSWTASGAVNGVAFNGVLSKTVYTAVYQSNVAAAAGRVDLTWRLAAPGTNVRAGTYQAALRWRFEAVTP